MFSINFWYWSCIICVLWSSSEQIWLWRSFCRLLELAYWSFFSFWNFLFTYSSDSSLVSISVSFLSFSARFYLFSCSFSSMSWLSTFWFTSLICSISRLCLSLSASYTFWCSCYYCACIFATSCASCILVIDLRRKLLDWRFLFNSSCRLSHLFFSRFFSTFKTSIFPLQKLSSLSSN